MKTAVSISHYFYSQLPNLTGSDNTHCVPKTTTFNLLNNSGSQQYCEMLTSFF